MGKTLFEKIWDAHAVRMLEDGRTQLFIDTHLIHEVTSPQAFEMARDLKLKVKFPERTFATVDHIIPTEASQRQEPFADSLADAMMKELRKNCAESGIAFFDTPTGKQARIETHITVFSNWSYMSGGDVFEWTETVIDVDPDTGEETEGDPQTYKVELSANLQRSSEEGSEGYDTAFVHVIDKSGPQHFKVEPATLQGTVGKTIPEASALEIKILENDPFFDEDGLGPLTGHLLYSTCLHGWEHLDGEKGLCQQAPSIHPHAHHCDCMAYHKERWVWKVLPLSQAGVEQVPGPGGGLAYAVVTMQLDGEMEPLPWHFAQGSTGYSFESAQYEAFQPMQMKYFVVAKDGAGLGLEPPFTDGAEDGTAKQQVAPATVVNIGGINGPNPKDQKFPPTGPLLAAIGASGEAWGTWGTFGGVDDVTDDAMPDIRVFVTDTKYGWTHLFGHANALDGSLEPYKGARGGGSTSSDTNQISPYLAGPEAPEQWVFHAESQYLDQLAMIRAGDFAPHANIADGAPWGLWVDEDTRLVFKVVCRDNINQWERPEGLAFDVSLVDGPAGATVGGADMGMTGDGVFEYVFRDPNRGKNAVDRDCTLTVTTSDAAGNGRSLVINFYVASNELKLQTLEEERRRRQAE